MQNHHILAKRFADHIVVHSLAGRFDIEAVRNRMMLPADQAVAAKLGSSPHSGGHLGSYYDGFGTYLVGVEKSRTFTAAQAGSQQALDEICSDLNWLVAAAKYAHANGHLLANTPDGMTAENANRLNANWFKNWRKYAEENKAHIEQMTDTIEQLSNLGQRDQALHWPLLSPTEALSLAERSRLLGGVSKDFSFTQHFTPAEPAPALPVLLPSYIDTRLTGFDPHPTADLNKPEGFTSTNPLTYKSRGFQAIDPDWQRIGQPPPSTAAPTMPQVLQFNPETGQQMFMSDGSPMLGPNPYDMPRDPNDPSPLAGLGLFAAAMVAPELAMVAPELLALLPAWASRAGFVGAASMATGSAVHAQTGKNNGGGIFATGAPAFSQRDISSTDRRGQPLGISAAQAVKDPFDRASTGGDTFADRFGNWPAATAAQPPRRYETPAPPAAVTPAPREVRRLMRVNTSNAGNAFELGSSPVPYLPSAAFNDRFGLWTMPTGEGRPQQTSGPVDAFADEPSYAVAPPIWGLENPINPRNDAEEWFSRWIQPLIRQE